MRRLFLTTARRFVNERPTMPADYLIATQAVSSPPGGRAAAGPPVAAHSSPDCDDSSCSSSTHVRRRGGASVQAGTAGAAAVAVALHAAAAALCCCWTGPRLAAWRPGPLLPSSSLAWLLGRCPPLPPPAGRAPGARPLPFLGRREHNPNKKKNNYSLQCLVAAGPCSRGVKVLICLAPQGACVHNLLSFIPVKEGKKEEKRRTGGPHTFRGPKK